MQTEFEKLRIDSMEAFHKWSAAAFDEAIFFSFVLISAVPELKAAYELAEQELRDAEASIRDHAARNGRLIDDGGPTSSSHVEYEPHEERILSDIRGRISSLRKEIMRHA